MKWTLKDVNQMIAEVDRELTMRKEVYPRLIRSGKMSQETADAYTGRLLNVRDLLGEVRLRIYEKTPAQTLLNF